MQHGKHIRQWAVVGLLSLLLSLMFSGILTWYALLHQTKAEMTSLSQETLYTVGGYLAEAQDLLNRTRQNYPQDCSLKSRAVFIPDLLIAVAVTDILYTLHDKTLCSLTYGDTLKTLPQKSFVTAWKGTQLFILSDNELAAGKGHVLVGQRGVFALLPRQQLVRFTVFGQALRPQLRIVINQAVLVYSDNNTVPDNQWLVVSQRADSGLLVEFAVPFTALRTYWLHTFWPTQWAINLSVLLSCSVLVYGYVRYRLSLHYAIQRALQRKTLSVHYQPIVEIKTGRIQSLEALIRWPTLGGQHIPADVFIAEAEKSGLICEITHYVLRQAIMDLNMLHQAYPELVIAVNISAMDLSSPDFAKDLRVHCAACGLLPRYLKLEITERSLVDGDSAKNNMLSLSDAGFVFALDDFGTGYSSLSYLHKMPVQILKIDRSFIAGLGMTVATGSVVPQIVSMARQLGMDVIAEGVETAEQAQALSDLEVQYAQGWLYDKAMPLGEIHKKLCLNQQQPYPIPISGGALLNKSDLDKSASRH